MKLLLDGNFKEICGFSIWFFLGIGNFTLRLWFNNLQLDDWKLKRLTKWNLNEFIATFQLEQPIFHINAFLSSSEIVIQPTENEISNTVTRIVDGFIKRYIIEWLRMKVVHTNKIINKGKKWWKNLSKGNKSKLFFQNGTKRFFFIRMTKATCSLLKNL